MKVGLLTGGGDCPGLNAVIRAVVRTGYHQYGFLVMGIEDGFQGLMSPVRIRPLGIDDVRGILTTGGTILGTSNQGNPFKQAEKAAPDAPPMQAPPDLFQQWIENYRQLRLDALIVVGGDGTLRVANELLRHGVSVVGVPKTIDNDISATEYTFGFDTAVQTATEALDKLHSTGRSHHRTMYLEVMGRHAGWIALYAGIAGGADAILIPEIPFYYNSVAARIRERIVMGRNFCIIVVAEGARPAGGEPVYGGAVEAATGTSRLGGIAEVLSNEMSRRGIRQEARVTVLGHLQRGGSPTAFDRALATRYGMEAARLVAEKQFGRMVSLHCGEVSSVPLSEAIGRRKQVPPNGELVRVAKATGIIFGEK